MNIYLTNISENIKSIIGFNNKHKNIGKYGLYRLEYIKHNNFPLYKDLMLKGTLNNYLYNVNKNCETQLLKLVNYYKIKDNLTVELQDSDKDAYIKSLGIITNKAEEQILKEIIFN